MKFLKGLGFGKVGGQTGYSSETFARFNPLTQGARQGRSIVAGQESIPDGWSITGTTYRSMDGQHDSTLLHVAPEVQNQSLSERTYQRREYRDRDV